MTRLTPTASQTAGPFFSIGTAAGDRTVLAPEGAPARIRIEGRVLDGSGVGVPDAFVEIWQADSDGRFPPETSWDGFGRSPTDRDGRYRFVTVKPGARAPEAPHIEVAVFARGLLQRLVTRIYFPEDARLHGEDPLLPTVPEKRRATLIASRIGDGAYSFDIRLQGEGETVFLAF